MAHLNWLVPLAGYAESRFGVRHASFLTVASEQGQVAHVMYANNVVHHVTAMVGQILLLNQSYITWHGRPSGALDLVTLPANLLQCFHLA